MNQLKKEMYEIIFEADTPMGKLFDTTLLGLIILSVLAVCMESVSGFRLQHGELLRNAEWIFTILFTIEYIARLYCSEKASKYALSFYGIVDLLSILPAYISFFIMGIHSLLVVRALRLLRVFRVLKLGNFLAGAEALNRALRASRHKISVFLMSVLTIVLIAATFMYLIEGETHGFTSIPKSIYWAIVTMTTVGYGDLAPQTNIGQTLASILMLVGYAIIAIPTGIVSAEMVNINTQPSQTKTCLVCKTGETSLHTNYCHNCGRKLI